MADGVLKVDDRAFAAGVKLRDKELTELSNEVKSLKVGDYRTLRKIGPHGALQARASKNGAVSFFWRSTIQGRSMRVPIGIYDPRALRTQREPTQGAGYSITAAVVRATVMAVHHDEWLGDGGYPAYVASRAAPAVDKVDGSGANLAPTLASEQRNEDSDVSLAALLRVYWEGLATRKAPSAADVQNGLTRHVIEAFPALAARPASSITTAACTEVLRRLKDKARTGNKVRSHMRSAFRSAMETNNDPNVTAAYGRFGISTNPVASTVPLKGGKRPDKRPYRRPDLQAYWKMIKDVPGVKGAVLRLHLFAGGPRIRQFSRLLTEDILGSSIVLYDIKGPENHIKRPYELPLPAACLPDIETIKNSGTYAIALDGGKRAISHFTISNWAQDIVGSKLPGFQLKRIRSSATTLFNALQVPDKISGRIQSHGITGVKARHYDGYEYLDEKGAALAIYYQAITGLSANPTSPGPTPLDNGAKALTEEAQGLSASTEN